MTMRFCIVCRMACFPVPQHYATGNTTILFFLLHGYILQFLFYIFPPRLITQFLFPYVPRQNFPLQVTCAIANQWTHYKFHQGSCAILQVHRRSSNNYVAMGGNARKKRREKNNREADASSLSTEEAHRRNVSRTAESFTANPLIARVSVQPAARPPSRKYSLPSVEEAEAAGGELRSCIWYVKWAIDIII